VSHTSQVPKNQTPQMAAHGRSNPTSTGNTRANTDLSGLSLPRTPVYTALTPKDHLPSNYTPPTPRRLQFASPASPTQRDTPGG
jgi:hypothetical protein